MQKILLLIYASVLPLIGAYDFSKFPSIDIPPPVNPIWSWYYNMSLLPEPLPPVKFPENSLIYPTCPSIIYKSGSVYRDWGCFNQTQPEDLFYCPGAKDWALTYDDGPSPMSRVILSDLARANVKATFCVVGSRVREYPDILKEMYDAGHDICVHTWSHRYLTTQTRDQIVSEMEWTIRAIQQVIGVRPTVARPPFGDMDNRVRAVLKNMNLTPLIWNRDTYDWEINSPGSMYNQSWIIGNFSTWVRDGQNSSYGYMSLQHDLYKDAVSQANGSLSLVLNAGYNVKSASACLGYQPYMKAFSAPDVLPPGVSLVPVPLDGASSPGNTSTPTTELPQSSSSESIGLLFSFLFFITVTLLLN